MTTIIAIRNPRDVTLAELCDCWRDGPDQSSVAHCKQDHDRVASHYVVERRCSLCDLPWGEGAISRHECRDGNGRYADCVAYLETGDILRYG